MDKRLFVFMKHGEKARTLVHFLNEQTGQHNWPEY